MSNPESSEASPLPLFVIVSGSPASGKSSLAEEIASELNLPLLSRDDIKEALMDVYPADDREGSKVAGSAAFKAMYQVLGSMLQVGVGVVLESTFEKGRSEDDLRGFFDRSTPIQVSCQASTEVLKDRLAERIRTGSRHPGHQDEAAYLEAEEAMARGDYDPLDLDIPCIEVNSDDGFDPDVPEIVRRIGEIHAR